MTIAKRTKATEAVRERVMVKSKVPENVKVTETEKLSDIVDQFSSRWYMRSEKPICATPRLSEVSPTFAFETVPMFV